MDKLKAAFKNSVTILWARIQVAGGAMLVAVIGLKDDPNVQNAIHTVLQPKFVPWYLIAIGVLTELTRRRTADK